MNSFAVCHMDKYKGSDLGGLGNHIDRIKISKNVDSERVKNNLELVEAKGSLKKMVADRIRNGYLGKRKLRDNAVHCCGFILSGSPELMNNLSKKEILNWAAKNHEFFSDRYGIENIVRCSLHLDEETPHLHLHLVPLTEDGRLSAKDIFNKIEMKQLQSTYAEAMREFGLKRGVSSPDRKHITTKQFYKYLEVNEMDAEEVLKSPIAKEIVGKMLQELQGQEQIRNMQELTKSTNKNYYERNEREVSRRARERNKIGENNNKGSKPNLQ
ncbi:MAG: MobV family relaxase [Labilibaculum antarcticum]